MTPAFDEIVPHPDDPDLELLHERAYIVRSYRKVAADGSDLLVLRGAVRDQKPPGLYVAEDPDPLTIHHMVVDLHVAVPSLEIVDAHVVMEMHPHTTCPTITEHYRSLIGLSIARGFTHKVRELFGGPRGCTHTTALLQAIAPVAVQSMWSFSVKRAQAEGAGSSPVSDEQGRERALAMNLNTCHVWAEDGEHIARLRAGEPMEVPVWITERFAKLGLDPEQWRNRG